jgi:hypothetical protein
MVVHMKIKALQTLSLGATIWLGAASTASADVQLTMQNGRVSIVAKDATIRQILTEWARVGHTKIVNVERIPGGPMTIELNNVTESQALEVLLRAMSGYIAAPRPVEAANLSRFDRIIVMPTLASARPAVASTPPPVFQQQAPQFVQQPPQVDDDADDQQPPPNVIGPPQNRGPVFNTFPQQPQFVNPQQPQMVNPMTGQPQPVQPTTVAPQFQMPQQQQPPMQQLPNQPPGFPSAPSAPFGGVAVPGMVAPVPQQQPGQPQMMNPPPRRPGGV